MGRNLIDFKYIRYKANELLLSQPKEIIKVPLLAENIVFKGKRVIFDTIENYAQVTNCNINKLTANKRISNGLIIKNSNVNIILNYQSLNSETRSNWTNAHEIGHLVLNHENDDGQSEVEANFFASCVLMPDAVIKSLLQYGMRIFSDTLCYHFGVSLEAANKKVDAINKLSSIPPVDNDKKIVELFSDEINKILWDKNTLYIDMV